LHEGYKWREKKQRENMAVLSSWLTAPHLKNPVEPSEFMKTFEDPSEKKTFTKEQKDNDIKELKEMLGVN
jgi:hypothetical protein